MVRKSVKRETDLGTYLQVSLDPEDSLAIMLAHDSFPAEDGSQVTATSNDSPKRSRMRNADSPSDFVDEIIGAHSKRAKLKEPNQKTCHSASAEDQENIAPGPQPQQSKTAVFKRAKVKKSPADFKQTSHVASGNPKDPYRFNSSGSSDSAVPLTTQVRRLPFNNLILLLAHRTESPFCSASLSLPESTSLTSFLLVHVRFAAPCLRFLTVNFMVVLHMSHRTNTLYNRRPKHRLFFAQSCLDMQDGNALATNTCSIAAPAVTRKVRLQSTMHSINHTAGNANMICLPLRYQQAQSLLRVQMSTPKPLQTQQAERRIPGRLLPWSCSACTFENPVGRHPLSLIPCCINGASSTASYHAQWYVGLVPCPSNLCERTKHACMG